MNRTELVAAVAEKTGMTKSAAGEAFDALFSTLAEAAKAGDKVVVPGWFKLVTLEKAARTARNPATGTTVEVPAKTVVKITAGPKFLD